MRSEVITPKVPIRRWTRATRRRLLSQDVELTSGVTADPSIWDPSLRMSPTLFDDCTLVCDSQHTASPVSAMTDRTVPDSHVISLSPTDSSSGTPSLFALGTGHSEADESSLLVTSAMLPPESPSADHTRTVSALILANQRINSLLRQIEELKANNIASVALQSIETPAVHVSAKRQMPVLQDRTQREILLFRASGRFTVLSNFFESNQSVGGVLFRSAEHAYQHKKALFHGRSDTASRVLRSRTPHQAKLAAKNIIQCKAWHDCKADVMATILEEKAKQCNVFRKALENTGNKRLVHNTETDSYWGCGEDFQGLNTLGSLLEDLRQRLHLVLPQPVRSRLARMSCQSRPAPTPTTLNRPQPNHPRTPAVIRPKVLVLGNSNARGVAQGLNDRGLDACGFALPGGTIPHVTSRLRHVRSPTDYLLLMVGDIEAADGLPAESICARYEHMLKEARHLFPWTRVMLSGLPQTGSNHRQDTIRKVNSFLEAVAHDERLVEYVSNARANLRDDIHLSRTARERLCFNVSCAVKKVFM